MSGHELRTAKSRELTELFFRNINYLRKKEGLSLVKMVNKINDKDFKVNYQAVARYSGRSKTRYTNASLYYLAAFALCFGRSMGELLTVDLEAAESSKD